MKQLWIAEKPSVASDIVKALGGNFTRHDGYAESSTDIVSYCVGHVLEMVPPEQINPAYATWSLDTLPYSCTPSGYNQRRAWPNKPTRLLS